MRFVFIATCSVALGCSHAPPPSVGAAEVSPVSANSPGGAARPGAASTSDTPNTFGSLVRSLSEHADEEHGSETCLFARQADAVQFVGRFAPAVHPVPNFDGALGALLTRTPAVDVLTRYGRYAPRETLPVFVAITEGAPFPRAALVALTERGALLRGVARGAFEDRLYDLAAAVTALRTAELDGVFLTADASTTTASLHDALQALSAAGFAVSLAAALPPSTALHTPDKPSAQSASRAPCPDGLPETTGPIGELDATALRQGLGPLTRELIGCLSAGSVAAMRGGRVRLALRIDARGGVSESCMMASELSDEDVLACVLGRARALRFAAPSPAGSVDAQIPLSLQPVYAPTPRAFCD